MITLVVGDNTWAGGDINIGFGVVHPPLDGTVGVDGQVVVHDGKLVRQEGMAAK